MRIALIFSPSWIRVQPSPPLGIATIARAATEAEIEVHQCDLEVAIYLNNRRNHQPSSKKPLIDLRELTNLRRVDEWIQRNPRSKLRAVNEEIDRIIDTASLDGYDFYGFSAMSHRQFASSIALAFRCKERNPDAIYGIGGVFVQNNADEIAIRYPFFNHVFANASWEVLSKALSGSFTGIKKTTKSGREDEKKIVGNSVVWIPKQPSIELMPLPLFQESTLQMCVETQCQIYEVPTQTPVLKYLLMTGCPSNCKYCSRNRLEKFEIKSPKKITEELLLLRNQHQTRLFSLEGNEINPTWSWSDSILTNMINKRLGIEWYSYAIPQGITERRAQRLREAGCRILRMGVESGSLDLLRKMRKALTMEELVKSIKAASAAGIWTHVNLIVGLPDERDEDIKKTADLLLSLENYIDSVKINPFFLHSWSDLYAEYRNTSEILIGDEDFDVVQFRTPDGRDWNDIKQVTVDRINFLYEKIRSIGIGYTGSCMDLLFHMLVHLGNKDAVKKRLRKKYEYMFENLPTPAIMWRLYYPEEKYTPFEDQWEKHVGRWGGVRDKLK